jgi:hypothetical protein
MEFVFSLNEKGDGDEVLDRQLFSQVIVSYIEIYLYLFQFHSQYFPLQFIA